MSNKKALFRFHWDCGRMGDLEGVFVAEKSKVESIIGTEVYFGEVLGKHSEVFGELEKDDVEMVTDNQEFIEIFENLNLQSGYNPLDYC